jgi:hypothetical protein
MAECYICELSISAGNTIAKKIRSTMRSLTIPTIRKSQAAPGRALRATRKGSRWIYVRHGTSTHSTIFQPFTPETTPKM